MVKQPYISIVIVCYNYAHLLPRALGAIARQDFRDFEIVFVDNGCTDNSAEVMRTFSAKHPDIPLVWVTVEKNIGLSYGDSRGVEAATGKYLMFHDADDWMDDNTLQLLADAARANDADRVIVAFRDVDDSGRVCQVQELGKNPCYWLYSMVQGNLFRTSLYKELGIVTCTNSPDMEKSFWFSAHMKRAAFVHETCYNMLVHMDSTSHHKGVYKELITDSPYSMLKLIETCRPHIPAEEGMNHCMAVYQMTRVYYGSLFHYLRDAPIIDLIHIYHVIHKAMRKCVPDYLDHTRNGLKQKDAVRKYAIRVVSLAYILERLHLMPLGLICYHFLSKVHYFQQ